MLWTLLKPFPTSLPPPISTQAPRAPLCRQPTCWASASTTTSRLLRTLTSARRSPMWPLKFLTQRRQTKPNPSCSLSLKRELKRCPNRRLPPPTAAAIRTPRLTFKSRCLGATKLMMRATWTAIHGASEGKFFYNKKRQQAEFLRAPYLTVP